MNFDRRTLLIVAGVAVGVQHYFCVASFVYCGFVWQAFWSDLRCDGSIKAPRTS